MTESPLSVTLSEFTFQHPQHKHLNSAGNIHYCAQSRSCITYCRSCIVCRAVHASRSLLRAEPFMHYIRYCAQSRSCITYCRSCIACRAVHASRSFLRAEPFMHYTLLQFMHCAQSCSCITFVIARRAARALHTVAVHALRAELFMHHVRYCAQSRSCITH